MCPDKGLVICRVKPITTVTQTSYRNVTRDRAKHKIGLKADTHYNTSYILAIKNTQMIAKRGTELIVNGHTLEINQIVRP